MDFQFIIKTFERPAQIKALLASLEQFYPDHRAWIADDSREPLKTQNPNHRVLPCPFDIGLKAGRQIALGCVQTHWFVLLDDDFIVTERTDLKKLIETASVHGFSFCGGDVIDGPQDKGGRRTHIGTFQFHGSHLHVAEIANPFASEFVQTDVLANFYAARTQDVRELGGWDARLKIWGHEDIFLTAKKAGLKCAFCPDIIVEHWPYSPPFYAFYRNRVKDFWPRIVQEKHGLTSSNMWPRELMQINEEDSYEIRASYRHRKSVPSFDDTHNKDEYQRAVYEMAQWNHNQLGLKTVLDVGCGSAWKLVNILHNAETIGVELEPNLSFLIRTYPNRTWLDGKELDYETIKADLVIVADMLEHVENPRTMLQQIQLVKGVKKLVFSTPERARTSGIDDLGPPNSPYHRREWNLEEFARLIGTYFKVESQTVSAQGTQIILASPL